jgi:putative DNA primase/helicase
MADHTHDGGGDAAGGGTSSPAPPLKLVRLPEKRTLLDAHLEQLRASGLTDETIELANLYTETRFKALAELIRRRTYPRHQGAALVFPLYMPGATEPHAYRIKPNHPRTNKKGKPVRYEQPGGEHEVLVYFPPRARRGDWYRDTERALYWTEGEKKALALDQLDLTTVGLTGVWNWLDSKHRDESGEWRLHPHVREHVTVAGRRHVIVFDADATQNDQVMRAAQRLVGVLTAAGAAEVLFVVPPSREHKGIDDYLGAFGESPTRALLETATRLEGIDPSSPLQIAKRVRSLHDAPISDVLRLPEGYEVQKDGTLWKLGGDDKHGDVKVAPSPILIVRDLVDYYSHERRTELCFRRDERWHTLVANRRALVDARTMVVELATFGAPVTSNSAPKIVDWIEELERVNYGKIDRVHCVSRAGWHTVDGERAFILDRPVFGDERERALALDTRGDRRKMFGALAPRGSLRDHIAALSRAWDADPICAAMICGALAAPLLEPLGASNFAIHLPGDSSRGKTSMLKIAASVFGDPNNEAWLGSWNATGVAAELRAAVLTDLPQCYDEVGASDPQAIERSVYMLINGGGRARAKQDLSLRETPSWRTVVLSTGERELADHNTMTGAQVRVVHLPVNGFGGLKAAEVDELRETCAANAGSFGRAWIEHLLEIDDWASFRQAHRVAVKRLREAAPDPLQGRVAVYFATLMIAESIAHKLGLGAARGATMHALYARTDARELVIPLAERALDLVTDWAVSEPDAFPALELGTSGDESVKNTGKTRHGFRRGESQLLFIPRSLRAFLDGHKLSAHAVLTEWRRLGLIRCDRGHFDTKVRIAGNGAPRLIVLTLNGEVSP